MPVHGWQVLRVLWENQLISNSPPRPTCVKSPRDAFLPWSHKSIIPLRSIEGEHIPCVCAFLGHTEILAALLALASPLQAKPAPCHKTVSPIHSQRCKLNKIHGFCALGHNLLVSGIQTSDESLPWSSYPCQGPAAEDFSFKVRCHLLQRKEFLVWVFPEGYGSYETDFKQQTKSLQGMAKNPWRARSIWLSQDAKPLLTLQALSAASCVSGHQLSVD